VRRERYDIVGSCVPARRGRCRDAVTLHRSRSARYPGIPDAAFSGPGDGLILAAITAAGGGVLRDVLRSQSDIPTLKGSIYPKIALAWGLVYSIAILVLGK
jgi:hypothetical protein